MKHLFLCLLFTVGALTACSSAPSARRDGDADLIAARTLAAAAPPEGQPLDPWLGTERARITSERDAAYQRFEQAEKICWRRFAVNDCISRARTARRATLERLRQEDLALNAIERQRLTAARLKQLERKQQ
ncbi:MAG: hypothetical protein LBE78_10625 [Burkholderiaceae bacterium]|jgi:hypothetical protein|nr:hypothetical protein [Burkholderiaceae bacterium]